MRTIKFRGKCQRVPGSGSKWIYGSILQKENEIAIIGEETIKVASFSDFDSFIGMPVITETVGQFTGFKDVNGREIYEGDIVEFMKPADAFLREPELENAIGLVSMDNHELAIEFKKGEYLLKYHWSRLKGCKVIGNIFENPELF
jgi:uncharacterized phage protein (TIGR01671 family)